MPRGVVDCVLATDGGGWNVDPVVDVFDVVVSTEENVLAGESFMLDMSPVIDRPEARVDCDDILEDLDLESDSGGVSRETTLIPTESPVVAGINSDVMPPRLITVR